MNWFLLNELGMIWSQLVRINEVNTNTLKFLVKLYWFIGGICSSFSRLQKSSWSGHVLILVVFWYDFWDSSCTKLVIPELLWNKLCENKARALFLWNCSFVRSFNWFLEQFHQSLCLTAYFALHYEYEFTYF